MNSLTIVFKHYSIKDYMKFTHFESSDRKVYLLILFSAQQNKIVKN